MGVTSQWIDVNSNQINVDSEWMKYINGNLKLNQINIPGTHDSGTYGIIADDSVVENIAEYLRELGLLLKLDDIKEATARTQELNILQQLESGVRYLDLRLGYDSSTNSTIIVHGNSYINNYIDPDFDVRASYYNYNPNPDINPPVTGSLDIPLSVNCLDEDKNNLKLEKVLNICSNFLKDHDSETIIIHLKNENTCFGLNVDINYKKDRECVSETDEIIKDQVNKLITENARIYNIKGKENEIPILEDVRSNIVIVTRRTDYIGIHVNISDKSEEKTYYTEPCNFNNKYSCRFQDSYNLNVEDKWNAIESLILEQNSVIQGHDGTDHILAISFMNIANIIKELIDSNYLKNSANLINTALLDFNLELGRQYGWIVEDFINKDIARHIYQTNKYCRCGLENSNLMCLDNECCSRYGYCGVTNEYCDIGCQSGFGICNPSDSGNISPILSPNGTCGRNNGYSWKPGYCCSQYGYCGATTDHCGTGCQSDFGECR